MKDTWVVSIVGLLGSLINTQLQVCKSLSMKMPTNALQHHRIKWWLTVWVTVPQISILWNSCSTNHKCFLSSIFLILLVTFVYKCWKRLGGPDWKGLLTAHRTDCVSFQFTWQGRWSNLDCIKLTQVEAVRLEADFRKILETETYAGPPRK